MTRSYRKRDPQGNPDRLIQAVGSLLRKKGYTALGANAIAKEARVAKRYIVEHFDGKFGLIRAYLLRHDFWLPCFAKQRAKALPQGDAILQLFVGLLQEQFHYFLKHEELQRLILWQISEPHPLMQEINTLREKEGERLIGLAERHFEGSGIDLHAVIGLAVGGGYFYGLQAATHNGPVCGRDMNKPADVTSVSRTLAQQVHLAWWAAAAIKNGALPTDSFTAIYFQPNP